MTASAQQTTTDTSPNLALFYDTETTGLPLFSEPSEDPRQPHIVQLAACLVDLDTRHTLASMDVIVRPEAWTIPAEVAAIHGITQERAIDLGISESLAVEMFMELWARRHRVGHNEQFDARILRIALKRVVRDESVFMPGTEWSEIWKEGDASCTARMSTNIVKAPPHRQDARRRPPSLQDTHPGRGLSAPGGQAPGKRAQRHGRRAGLHGCVLRREGPAARDRR